MGRDIEEGLFGIKTKKEKEKEAKAKAEKERQKQRDKELKDQEERARQQATADSWARYDKAARDAKAEYNRSSSSQSSKVSNTGKAGVYYSGGDYYSESKSIKEGYTEDEREWALNKIKEFVDSETTAFNGREIYHAIGHIASSFEEEVGRDWDRRGYFGSDEEYAYELFYKAKKLLKDKGLFTAYVVDEFNRLVKSEGIAKLVSESKSIKESAQGTYSMRMYDFIDEYLDDEGRKDLCYAFTKWLSDDEVHEFAKANDLVSVFSDEEDLYEGIEKKYVKPLKDKIATCTTRQDLEEIGAYLDDMSDNDIDKILGGKITSKDLNKMFGGYNFVDDDFPGWNFKEAKCIKEPADDFDDFDEEEFIDRMYHDASEDELRKMGAFDNLNESNTETNTTYLARAMHNMYINGSDYEEIADSIGAPVSLVIKLIGPESYDETLTESVSSDLTKYRVALADYEDDDGYDQEDVEYLLKPGQTKGDLVVDLSYNAGFIGIYVHDERLATPEEIKGLDYTTFETPTDKNYGMYGDVDVEDWDDLLVKADKLLNKLCITTGNTDWNDGDGYWSAEVGSEWTMRNLFYSDTLANVDKLGKLCVEYSKKLPNVEFYYFEDNDSFVGNGVSEIGYTATNTELDVDESLTESTNKSTLYDLQVEAFSEDTDGFYSDADDINDAKDGFPYQYVGTVDSIVKKLNKIAKKARFNFIYITKENSDEVVFEADQEDALTFDTPILRQNSIIPNTAAFMKCINTQTDEYKRYVISNKNKPTKNDEVFYDINDDLTFDIVKLAYATKYNSLGDARFYANSILSMSDYHRINIFNADTLEEVDSLDYYVDYENEDDYPGYFDAE
jgi:hypothetical protein